MQSGLRFIRWSIYLTMGCLLLALAVGLKVWSEKGERQPAAAVGDDANLSISNLDYSEVREGRICWSVRAEAARYYKDKKEALLDQVQAVFFLEDGGRVEVEGDEGLLHKESKDMELWGRVCVRYGDDYRLTTDRLFYDNQQELIHTPEPVALQGQGLTLEGRGMSIEVAAGRLRILDNIHTQLRGFSVRPSSHSSSARSRQDYHGMAG